MVNWRPKCKLYLKLSCFGKRNIKYINIMNLVTIIRIKKAKLVPVHGGICSMMTWMDIFRTSSVSGNSQGCACHMCTAEMDNAEAPDPSDGIVVAGPVHVQTPVRQAAGTVAMRRAEDVTILQAFRNVVNEPGDEGCGVCWVLLDGKFMRHLVRKCPKILQLKLCFDCIRPPCWRTGTSKDCAKMLKVPEKSGLCFACGLGNAIGGEVHKNSPLEFGNEKACRKRKMLCAALALWECKRTDVSERFHELRLVDNRRVFVPALIADGSAPVPLLVLMINWWFIFGLL
jgi:hypothetical protein